jgi:Transglycosylase SLT domain
LIANRPIVTFDTAEIVGRLGTLRRVLRLFAILFALAAGVTLAVLAFTGGDDPPSFGPVTLDPGEPDPFAYEPDREDEFVERATAGHSHVLYAKSPGGAVATARRVERWRPQIEAAAGDAVDPDVLEAIVFLESAGSPTARAGDSLEGAVGLTQILAGTATSLLGMHVDVAASERLTRRIERRGPLPKLMRERRRVDERFDPAKALAGAVRYLTQARERFGRDDLAVVSYHMGMGNLENVLAAYGDGDASWAQVYFDATPRNHPRAYGLLSGFGDDSASYLWRVYAAREIMRLYRDHPEELRRLAQLQTGAASAELVLHPPAEDESANLRPFEGIRGLRLAARAEPGGLRPEAYELAVYLAAGVRGVSGSRAPLTVTRLYEDGWSFDVRRRYAGGAQAQAFQYMLDRLQSLNLIAWVRGPDEIHVTAAAEDVIQ